MNKDLLPQRKVGFGPLGAGVGYFVAMPLAAAFPEVFPDASVAVAMAGGICTFLVQYFVPNKG